MSRFAAQPAARLNPRFPGRLQKGGIGIDAGPLSPEQCGVTSPREPTMMLRSISMAAAIFAATIGSALAQQAAYTWTGMGINVPGSSKCTRYKMTIDVTVQGKVVKGLFQQEGRDQRNFEAMLDDKGMFKTKAIVGGGNSMDVTGTIKDGDTKVLLDGYCKFDAKLTKN
jgi:hypothetical protein